MSFLIRPLECHILLSEIINSYISKLHETSEFKQINMPYFYSIFIYEIHIDGLYSYRTLSCFATNRYWLIINHKYRKFRVNWVINMLMQILHWLQRSGKLFVSRKPLIFLRQSFDVNDWEDFCFEHPSTTSKLQALKHHRSFIANSKQQTVVKKLTDENWNEIIT